jgi:hypothetical protein
MSAYDPLGLHLEGRSPFFDPRMIGTVVTVKVWERDGSGEPKRLAVGRLQQYAITRDAVYVTFEGDVGHTEIPYDRWYCDIRCEDPDIRAAIGDPS